ncbi:Methyltransferase domain-containing protein [Streptoalloteichus tenebrarius]|uniref:Methyltransferase domain-containing protein n=1 Tax=Streptoalloteichus tenebrarius (strain ATCC 17920 / DSM 40477 / JCM 4838 / CBS 697.72 / NBRC 16177 / NCIMB 11028 / NRRL B-12390 / A12253. 1 / ISP 5477) TaxID=1933 RepID=A0ABT1I2Z9_STRSD|nr:Methyltransferase domain-containing protein [Streptoalloteichus tenebrarius]
MIAGQASYNRWTLSAYDLTVLGLASPLLWGCGRREMLRNYDRNVGARHVELGVGTGWFLDNCAFPVARPRITLVDLNPTALEFTARRLARYTPTPVRANVLEPLPVPAKEHDSVGLNFLLHCVPGDLRKKGVVLAHAAAVTRPGGRVFGATVLAHGVRLRPPARLLLRAYNAQGLFHNEADHLDDLRAQLEQDHFADYDLTVHGSVAVFSATVR